MVVRAAKLPISLEARLDLACELLQNAIADSPTTVVRAMITVLWAFQHTASAEAHPWLQHVEEHLHHRMRDKALPMRGALMVHYLAMIRGLPIEQCNVAYWVDTVSTFTAAQAADTLASATRWLFPPTDSRQCEASLDALLEAARMMRTPMAGRSRSRHRCCQP